MIVSLVLTALFPFLLSSALLLSYIHRFDKEIQISKRLEEVEKFVAQFNVTGRRMKIIPATAKYANNINYQISFNMATPEDTTEFLKSTVKVSDVYMWCA